MKENKVLLVTGASSDVGYALIKKVEGNYSYIWAHYSSTREYIDALIKEYGDKIIPVQADFTSEESVNNLIKNILDSGKYPDHMVHMVASKYLIKKFNKSTWEDYQVGLDVSLRSAVMMLINFIPYMTKQKYGKIVFMLTSNVLDMPPKFQSAYVTVKYAMLGLMKSLSVEYEDKGVMVNAVSPGMIETKFLSDIPELIVMQNAQNSPLKRNLTVDDVVPAFEYLLSDAADAVTGMNMEITNNSGGSI